MQRLAAVLSLFVAFSSSSLSHHVNAKANSNGIKVIDGADINSDTADFIRVGDGKGLGGKVKHDNYIYFDTNTTTPVLLNFTLAQFVITGGQPYDNTVYVPAPGQLLLKAGRHASSDVAASFVDGLQLVNMLATEKVVDAEPGKLNFAVLGTLNVTIGDDVMILDDARIGQGHYGTTNNWWFASSNCVTVPSTHVMTCGPLLGRKFELHTESKSDRYIILPV